MGNLALSTQQRDLYSLGHMHLFEHFLTESMNDLHLVLYFVTDRDSRGNGIPFNQLFFYLIK